MTEQSSDGNSFHLLLTSLPWCSVRVNGPIFHCQSRAKHLLLSIVNYEVSAFSDCVETALLTSIFSPRHQPDKRMANSSLLNYAMFEGILDYDCRVHHYIFIQYYCIIQYYTVVQKVFTQNIMGRCDLVFHRDRTRAFAEKLMWQVTRLKVVLPVMDRKTTPLAKLNTELSTVTLNCGSYKEISSNFTPSRPLAPSMT